MRGGIEARGHNGFQSRASGNEETAGANHGQIFVLGEIVSLLVVGSVAFDALESPYGKVDRTLGGAATYFALAASFFTPVSLVAITGDDFTEKDAAVFRGRHYRIDTDGMERAKEKTFFWSGRYTENLN